MIPLIVTLLLHTLAALLGIAAPSSPHRQLVRHLRLDARQREQPVDLGRPAGRALHGFVPAHELLELVPAFPALEVEYRHWNRLSALGYGFGRCARGGAGSVPLLAMALLMASTVTVARNSTISFASARSFFLSAIENPLIVAFPAFTRSS